MYKFYIKNVTNEHYYNELCKVFLRKEEYEIVLGEDLVPDDGILINEKGSFKRDEIVRELYYKLNEISGHGHIWGTLTGVRPLKPAYQAYEMTGEIDKAKELLKKTYLLSDEKVDMLSDIISYQLENTNDLPEDTVALYIGIPFCPSRCSYCSFTSNIAKEGEIDRYLDALIKEIRYFKTTGKKPETIYIGGGTPNVLSEEQLIRLLTEIKDNVDMSELKEYSFEAGRPDTVNYFKLDILKEFGVDRISINPQTFSQKTLKEIGRNHSVNEVYRAYELAREADFKSINSDLIAGLPGEGIEEFKHSLSEITALYPENVTVHSLAVKRGSKLDEEDPNYYRNKGNLVSDMLKVADEELKAYGYRPYYIYRQKHMAGALENIGYMRDKIHCLYNIRIMNERQTVVALGAGAISKMVYPLENRHERVPNVSNYEIYIDRVDEMIERKMGHIGGKKDGN